MAKTVSVRITGRVQGVSFRAWTEARAGELGVSGWVRNRSDGAVEALFCGPENAVDQLLAACRTGPPLARVDDVAATPSEETAPHGFQVRPTA
ncbi:MAG: acylphosphatase [Rhodothalassiaceae bacterium]